MNLNNRNLIFKSIKLENYVSRQEYRCIDCQMHEEAQRVDQPAQNQVVAAQQVKGHLRPGRKVEFKTLCCTLQPKNVFAIITCHNS